MAPEVKVGSRESCGKNRTTRLLFVLHRLTAKTSRIRKDCKKPKIDPLQSASKATMQDNTSKRTHKEPCNSPRPPPPHRSHIEVGEGCWPTCSSLTLPR